METYIEIPVGELIRTAYSYAKTMSKPALDNTIPAYRCPDGNRCPIGYILPDELYQASYKHETIMLLIQLNPRIASLVGGNLDVWNKLQRCHDGYVAHGNETWKDKMLVSIRCIAREYGVEL